MRKEMKKLMMVRRLSMMDEIMMRPLKGPGKTRLGQTRSPLVVKNMMSISTMPFS